MTRRHALTNAQLQQLVALYKPGVRGAGYESVARQLGVGVSTIRDAVTGRTAYAAARGGQP